MRAVDLYSGIGGWALGLDMADFGLPQRRRRMLAGHFPSELLLSYRASCSQRTLGDVMSALSSDPVEDPIYAIQLTRGAVRGLEHEVFLSPEEHRMNYEAK